MSCTNYDNRIEVCLPCAPAGVCAEVADCATLPGQFIDPDGDGFTGNPPVLPVIEPVVAIVCDTSYTSVITTLSAKSLFRTNTLLGNQRYYARFFTITISSGTTYTFTVTAPFSSYITFHRTTVYQSSSSSGTLVVVGTSANSGPAVVEVTTVLPYVTGGFGLAVSCALPVPTARGYWPYEDATPPWSDLGPQNKPLVGVGTGISNSSGLIANCALVEHDVLSTSATTASGSSSFVASSGAFTLCGWVNSTSYTPTSTAGFTQHSSGQRVGAIVFTNGSFLVRLYTVANSGPLIIAPTLGVRVIVTTSQTIAEYIDSFVFTPGSWHFWVMWFDTADNKVKFQVNDGAILSSATAITSRPTASTARVEGYNTTGDGAVDKYGIKVDEMVCYNKILSAAEKTALYNGGAGVTWPNIP